MKLFLMLLFLSIGVFSYGQGTITGNMLVKSYDTCEYMVSWDIPRSVPVDWHCDGGQIIETNNYRVKIVWNSIPTWVTDRSCWIKAIRGNSGAPPEVMRKTDNAKTDIPNYNETGRVDEVDSAVLNVLIENYRLTQSEFCLGVLGPRAVYQNFGAGLNPGAPLPNGATSYTYQAQCGLTPNRYTITNSTVGCRSDWLGLLEDHTPGDLGGYMLMVDGSQEKKDVYRTTVTNLTTSFKYEFSAWVANLTPPTIGGTNYDKPKLTFRIEDIGGNIVKTGSSIEVEYDPASPWKQISFLFDMPTGLTTVQVVLRNENNSYNGNDFVVDDISFAPCYSELIASFSPTTIVDFAEKCNSGSNNLYGRFLTTNIPYTNPSYQWERSSKSNPIWVATPSANTIAFPSVSESVTDIYYYRLKAFETASPGTYQYSNVLTFFVFNIQVESTNFDVYNCTNAPFQLDAKLKFSNNNTYSSNNFNFLWSPASYLNNPNIEKPLLSLPSLPLITNPVAPPPVPILYNYTVTASSPVFSGCTATGVHTIRFRNSRPVAVPSAFSPNGDGDWDYFWPINIEDYPGAWFKVWNRWGQKIFESHGPTANDYKWNGMYQGVHQPIGNYIWQVNIPGCPTNILNASMGNNSPNGWVILTR